MSNDLTLLGVRLLDTPGFSWRPGMKTTSGDRVIAVRGDKVYLDSIYPTAEIVHTLYLFPPELDDLPSYPTGRYYEGRSYSYKQLTNEVPDLSDGATRGAVLDLIREAYNSKNAHIAWERGWTLEGVVDTLGPVYLRTCPTEEEALIYSLESAAK